MSSVAPKHALLLFGTVSIAALFAWYIRAKYEADKRKKQLDALRNRESPPLKNEDSEEEEIATSEVNGVAEMTEKKVEDVEEVLEESVTIEPINAIEQLELQEESNEVEQSVEESEDVKEDIVDDDDVVEQVRGDANVISDVADDVVEQHGQNVDQNEKEPELAKESEKMESAEEGDESSTKNDLSSNEIVIEKQAESSSAGMGDNVVVNDENVLEEAEEENPGSPLSVDIAAAPQLSPAAFSWSEEMEKSYVDQGLSIEPVSDEPLQENQNYQSKKNNNRNRKNRNQGNKSAKQTPRKSIASEDEKVVQTAEVGYEQSESPGVASQNSEVSSQDSGRATGGLASSLSPLDEQLNGTTTNDDLLDTTPMYEFEIPNSLVGLVIGVRGKTIRELSLRTNVRMLIRQHHTAEKVDSHQICQVRGKRDEINHCLQMLRRRFPPSRFPELNLQPVLPPPLPNNYYDLLNTQPSWLTLPEEVQCEVAVSSIVDVSHFFLQQPTHPSFASLRHLDLYMLRLYSEHSQIPELPVPCQSGLLCAAPVINAWFRAVTVQYHEETDEVLVRFVDYGGYARMPRKDLKQIRTDLMSLPFQATEVMLAHVKPVDGTVHWGDIANEKFRQMCTGKVITAKLVGYTFESRMPMVELHVPHPDDKSKVMRFDQYLMEQGLARTSDPSKMVHPSSAGKRPSLVSQTSQTNAI